MSDAFLRHISVCTDHDPARFVPFFIEDRRVGAVSRDFTPLLSMVPGLALTPKRLTFAPGVLAPEERTRTLDEAAELLSKHHQVPLVKEIYPVINHWGDEPMAQIDRAAIPWFGTKGFGVHANGYVRKNNGLYIWVATRAKNRRIDPGKLDNLIGGGLPLGYTVQENLAKEAWEEAGVCAELAQTAKSVGLISYQKDMMKGVRNDSLFLFDLELPEDFVPVNTDGEVERFELLPAVEVAHIVATTDRFKFNCNLVMIDFFLRHNIIENESSTWAALNDAIQRLKT